MPRVHVCSHDNAQDGDDRHTEQGDAAASDVIALLSRRVNAHSGDNSRNDADDEPARQRVIAASIDLDDVIPRNVVRDGQRFTAAGREDVSNGETFEVWADPLSHEPAGRCRDADRVSALQAILWTRELVGSWSVRVHRQRQTAREHQNAARPKNRSTQNTFLDGRPPAAFRPGCVTYRDDLRSSSITLLCHTW